VAEDGGRAERRAFAAGVSDRWLPAFTFVALLVLWEVVVHLFQIPSFVLPPPSAIAREMWNLRGQLGMHTWATLLTTLTAFAVTVVVTVPLAVLITAFPLLWRSRCSARWSPSSCNQTAALAI
jgi:ABC-type nitrate/sulfonate/bicarbonate transport system permease component